MSSPVGASPKKVSPPAEGAKLEALHREWWLARIVVIGGLIAAVAVAGYFAYKQRSVASLPQQIAVAPKKVDPKLLAQAELAVCTAELIRAQNLGVVPAYGVLATGKLVRADVDRRFICEAKTHLTQYYIAADLLCNKLTDARCVSIYRVAVKDGSLVYNRPQ